MSNYVLQYLRAYGSIWQYLMLPDRIWYFMAVSDSIWCCLMKTKTIIWAWTSSAYFFILLRACYLMTFKRKMINLLKLSKSKSKIDIETFLNSMKIFTTFVRNFFISCLVSKLTKWLCFGSNERSNFVFLGDILKYYTKNNFCKRIFWIGCFV